MKILFNLTFFIFIIYLIIFRNNHILIALMSIFLICFFAIGNGFIPVILLKTLTIPQSQLEENPVWAQHNAIVVLGSGTSWLPALKKIKPMAKAYSRILVGAQLYTLCKKSGKSCHIILSGGDATHTGITEAQLYKNELLDIGIKDADIILEPNSLNTFENAKFTGELLQKQHFDKVYLVTSGIHLKRAFLYFSHCEIKVTPYPSDYIKPIYTFYPNAINFSIADAALHELAGVLRFYLYQFFHLRINSTGPGAF